MDPQTPHRNVYRKPLQNRKTNKRKGQRREHPPGAHSRGYFRRKCRGHGELARRRAAAVAHSARPRPAPARLQQSPAPDPSQAGSGRALPPFPSAGVGGGGSRGGARSRAACSRTSPGFGCVRPAARPLPPLPPRFPFAGRRLRGAGASRRRRDAAGVHRPPELPGPGARCGALL